MKAIDTFYNGYLFRSRLEARWAVFFDALKIEYEYEKEGYEFSDGTRYLPDFHLPDSNTFVEVKGGTISDSDLHKVHCLARQHDGRVYIVSDIDLDALTQNNNIMLDNLNTENWDYYSFYSDRMPEICWACGKTESKHFLLNLNNDNFGFHMDFKTNTFQLILGTVKCQVCNAETEILVKLSREPDEVETDVYNLYFKHNLKTLSIAEILCGPIIKNTFLELKDLVDVFLNKLTPAIEIARTARFEHGQTPQVVK